MNWHITRAARQLHRSTAAIEKVAAESRASSKERIALKDAERTSDLRAANDKAFGRAAAEAEPAPVEPGYELEPTAEDDPIEAEPEPAPAPDDEETMTSQERIALNDAERSAALHSADEQAFGDGGAIESPPMDDPYGPSQGQQDGQGLATLIASIVADMVPTQLLSIAGPAVGDQQLGDPVLFGREDGSDGAFWGNAPGAKFNFLEHGKIWLAGVELWNFSYTYAQASADDLYIAINLETTAVTVTSGSAAPEGTDKIEYYQIRRDGVQVQNSDIHITRTA